MRCAPSAVSTSRQRVPATAATRADATTTASRATTPAPSAIASRSTGGEKNYLLHYRYGITRDQVSRLLAAQKGLCAICKVADPKHVDHSHRTRKVRGLLCLNCNQGIGRFEDDVPTLRRAIEYLRPHDS